MKTSLTVCFFVAALTKAVVPGSVQERFMLQPGVTLVGFTYGQTSHVNVTDGSVLSFDKAITAVGSKSPIPSGQFVCFTDGIYKFQVYALTRNDTEVWLELYKNNDMVVSVYAHTLDDYADTGNAVILELSVGDTVYVKSHDQHEVVLFGAPDEIYTTFSAVYFGSSFQSPVGLTPAFSVAIDKHMYVTGGTKIVYNKVITDVANIYDNTTGTVTIKTPGIYVIQFFSVSRQGEEIYQELYHNTNFVCALYNYADNEWSNAGNTALLHLNAGDTVYVSAASGYDNSIYGGTDEVYSTFNGALIATENDVNKQGSNVVAFTVGLSKDQTIVGGQKVAFDQVIINLHQAYNMANSVFSAPIAGVYEFNFHALGQTDAPIWLELYKNQQYVNSLYSHNPGTYASGGNSAVLQLDAGDTVHVEATAGNDNALYGRGDEIYCTFSGYLLRPAPGKAGPIVG